MEVRICFYAYFEDRKKKLTYSDINKIASDKNNDPTNIGDPSQVVIQFNDDVEKDLESNPDHDITGIMKDVGNFKNLQLNVVYKIFQTAQKEILEIMQNNNYLTSVKLRIICRWILNGEWSVVRKYRYFM